MIEKIVQSIIDEDPSTRDEFNEVARKACSALKVSRPANKALISTYQKLLKNGSIEKSEALERFMKKASIRSLSGVSIITSLVKPYNCPGKCIYCPTEVRMPKSYIATEPAAARALALNFSPYDQMARRIKMLEENGHDADKIEFIIKGGTWNAYPIKYQYWFIYESFKACNDLSRKTKIGYTEEKDFCKKSLVEIQKEIEREQLFNETSKYRVIGITLETRPDAISPKTISHMRLQGCTRIELGLQAPDDEILRLIVRGHTVKQFKDAMRLLRSAGFKVDLHFMPDLPGTTADHDVKMYKELFSDIGLRPDMVKIYPNTVIKSAELYKWWEQGRYKPYGEEKLFDAILKMKLSTPKYCRISRLIRDIPTNEIYDGNKITNLREDLSAELIKQNKKCICLRCREIGRHKNIMDANLKKVFFIDEYETEGGHEFFLTYEDPNREAVYGFLRLRIPNLDEHENNKELNKLIPEIKDCAFVRELHVYGTLVSVGKYNELASQHKGTGKKLMIEAEKIASEKGLKKIAVISGVGVREYYKKIGYEKVGTYMVKNI